MDDQEMQLKVRRVTDKFTESMYVLANEPSVALYRLQEHVRRSLPELVQHKTDMQSWEEQSQGAIYTVEYACSAVKSMTNSSLYFKNIDGLLRQAITLKEQTNSLQGRSPHMSPPPHVRSTSSWPPHWCVQEKSLLTPECPRKERSKTLDHHDFWELVIVLHLCSLVEKWLKWGSWGQWHWDLVTMEESWLQWHPQYKLQSEQSASALPGPALKTLKSWTLLKECIVLTGQTRMNVALQLLPELFKVHTTPFSLFNNGVSIFLVLSFWQSQTDFKNGIE